MARTHRQHRRQRHQSPPPLPPPARLLRELVGKNASQLHPKHTAKVHTGEGLLVTVWHRDGRDPAETFLPCKKNGRIRLIDHKEALEAVDLHPNMRIQRYTRKPRAKEGLWAKISWDTWIDAVQLPQFGPNETKCQKNRRSGTWNDTVGWDCSGLTHCTDGEIILLPNASLLKSRRNNTCISGAHGFEARLRSLVQQEPLFVRVGHRLEFQLNFRRDFCLTLE
ncbi:hypothetical protein B0H19DRAFT_1078000 [Mycena capillaripes]|nr:hypothetical protein B0H19DRAFT_1078000 [Mycena capillaripes]